MRIRKYILPMVIGLATLLALRAWGSAEEVAKTPEKPVATEEKGNDRAIKDFGVEKSDPIDSDFFLFSRGKYIDAPYVVERRGLDIYINSVLMIRGPAWPPLDLTVKDDPGDPPSGDHALWVDKGADSYWSRKWRYLKAHHDVETAVQMYMESYKKCDAVAEVIPDPRDKKKFSVVTKKGTKFGVDVEAGAPHGDLDELRDKDKVLASARGLMDRYVSRVKSGGLLLRCDGGWTSWGPADAVKLIDVLLSEDTPERRLAKVQEKHILFPEDKIFSVIATEFEAGPQIKERLEKAKKNQAEKAKE